MLFTGEALDAATIAGNAVSMVRDALRDRKIAASERSLQALADAIAAAPVDPSGPEPMFSVPDSTVAGAGGLADPPGDSAAAGPGEPDVQHPILTPHDGGAARSVATWEARAEVDFAVFIRRYLAERPCPGPSSYLEEFRRWADRLERHGLDRLQASGAQRLRCVD